MVHLFRFNGNTCHESECFGKIAELEFAIELIVFSCHIMIRFNRLKDKVTLILDFFIGAAPLPVEPVRGSGYQLPVVA